MAERANLAIKENGQVTNFPNSYGAYSVAKTLGRGPKTAMASIREGEPTAEWFDEVWCEGAALVDVDDHVVLFYESGDFCGFAHTQDEEPRCQGIERARVPDLEGSHALAHLSDHVVRSRAARLVDEQQSAPARAVLALDDPVRANVIAHRIRLCRVIPHPALRRALF